MCLWNRFNLINQQPWSQCMKQHRTRTPYYVSVCKSDGIYAQPPMSEPETVEISYPSLQRTVVLCKRVILCSELLCFCYLWFAQYPHMKEGLRMERQQYATCFDGGFQNSHIVFFLVLPFSQPWLKIFRMSWQTDGLLRRFMFQTLRNDKKKTARKCKCLYGFVQ